MSELTHLDASGAARMVDISGKAPSSRRALAQGRINMRAATLALALEGGGKKGDVRAVARIAGIMAAKRTADLIPLCHPISLASIDITIEPDIDTPGFVVTADVKTIGQTGVEMEALSAVSIACLTLYDMLKAVDRGMSIDGVSLVEKSGGASGDYRRAP